MNKPISVARVEFINSITRLISESGLQPYVLEPILRDVANDIKILTQKQYQEDLKKYQDSQGISKDKNKSE